MPRTLPILSAAAVALSMITGTAAPAAECLASSSNANAIGQDEAARLYECLADEMASTYAEIKGVPGVPDYRDWETVSTAPLASTTHGSMLVTHVPNPLAAGLYKRWEGLAGQIFPPGAIVVKESIRLTEDGKAVVGQLFLMEKAAPGTAPETDGWIYTRIFSDGQVQRTGSVDGDRLLFCHDCHAVTLDTFDGMFFPPRAFRTQAD